MKSETRVCVLGAGVCGLVSVKACLEAGFQVTCYEQSPHFGGLWCYQDDKRGGSSTATTTTTDVSEATAAAQSFIPSVMRTTILNTSKELSAFSDFPPPAHLPNFMKHNLYMDYIRSYVEHFKLQPHLKLRHQVLHCEPVLCSGDGDGDKEPAIEWLIEVKDLATGETFTKEFDKLMIAVGHHNVPHTPTFPDQHKFKGQIVHSARVKDILNDERFAGKRVAVVGLGNSACDAANDLALVAERCYVSCHRGSWFVGRLSPKGLYDFEDKNRWTYYRSKFLTSGLLDKIIIGRLESRTNHTFLGLTPKHRPSEQVPAINDLFPFRVFTGGITLKGALLRFTEDGLIFEGEEEQEHKVDIVVLATGYLARVPFLNEFQLGLKSAEHDDEHELYLNMFAPKLRVGSSGGAEQATPPSAIKSLAFIGLVQPTGSITVISELQARLAALVFDGRRELPSVAQMMEHIREVRRKRSAAIRSHSKDQLVGNWIGYSDLVAGKIGAKPNLAKMFFKDFPLWKRLFFGPSVSYQYRLSGPGSWDKARETIMEVEARVYQGINEGKNHILFQARRKCLSSRKTECSMPSKGENGLKNGVRRC